MTASMGGKLLVVTALIGAMLIMSTGGADASPETTCKAVAGRDKRVDYAFCVSQLSAQNGSADADTWGLAKAAAVAGIEYTGATQGDIEDRLGRSDARKDPANGSLGECYNLYHRARQLFGNASTMIKERDYEAAKETIAKVPTLVRDCDGTFASHALRSPFTKQSAESAQLAIICTAIIDLIDG
ncbi:unnamed protein product [Alopecurus aequalis]